jgi:hypothetical protein
MDIVGMEPEHKLGGPLVLRHKMPGVIGPSDFGIKRLEEAARLRIWIIFGRRGAGEADRLDLEMDSTKWRKLHRHNKIKERKESVFVLVLGNV